MLRAVTFFLIFIVILAIFGRLRLPGLPKLKRRAKISTVAKCPRCGRYPVAGEPCICGDPG